MTNDIIEIEVPEDLDRKAIVLALSNRWWASQLNTAHFEGRKAAEKDFRELLDMASKMRDAALGIRCEFHSHYATMLDNASEEFAAWKKARGIK